MRVIQLTQRAARLLRENLTTAQDGYDYTDLCRLDHLAKKLTVVQGSYAERMAELAREEKRIRREFLKGTLTQPEADRQMNLLSFEVEELNEEAAGVQVELRVEDGDYRLIRDKLSAVGRWMGNDELRGHIIGLVDAVENAGAAEVDD